MNTTEKFYIWPSDSGYDVRCKSDRDDRGYLVIANCPTEHWAIFVCEALNLRIR